MTRRTAGATLAQRFDGSVLALDGVVSLGTRAVPRYVQFVWAMALVGDSWPGVPKGV